MPTVPFMSSLFPHNYTLKVSSSRPQQPHRRRPELHPLQKRIDDPEPSFSDLVLALPMPPSLPNSNAASPTSAMFENAAAMKSAPALQLAARASSGPGYSRRPSDHTHLPTPPPALSKARSGSDLRGRAAAQRTPSLTPRSHSRGAAVRSTRPSTPTRRERPREEREDDIVTFESCMEGEFEFVAVADLIAGTAYEAQSSEAGHQGVLAARHLRLASNLFGQALALRPHSAWARLRRASMLFLMSQLEDPPTTLQSATAQLQEARGDLLHLSRAAPGSMTVRETLARVSGELALVHLAGADEAPAGRLAIEALECMEEVAAERMDRAAQLSRAEFGPQTPSLAAMFLHLAEAAGAAAVLAHDASGVEELAELAEKALDQATNMVGLAATMLPPGVSTTALITRVQLASGRLTVDRLRHLAVLGAPFHEADFAGPLRDLTLLADETRERAADAAAQAYECARLLGDTLWLVACLMRGCWGEAQPAASATTTSVPCAAHAQPTPEGYVYSRSRAGSVGPAGSSRGSDGSLPVLDRSRQSSTTSIGSLESPPIAEEVIVEEDDVSPSWAAGGGTKPAPPPGAGASGGMSKLSPPRPTTLPEPAQTPKGRRRPPPLQLSLPPPVCPLPPVPSPLSPLNPAHPRRASETRPRLPRQFSGTLPSGSVPRRASSGSARSPNALSPLSSLSAPAHAPPPPPPPAFERAPVPPAKTLELARRAIEHLEAAEARYQQALACLPDGGARARARAEVLLQLAAVNLFKAAVPRALLQALGTERRGSYLIAAEVYANKALEAVTPRSERTSALLAPAGDSRRSSRESAQSAQEEGRRESAQSAQSGFSVGGLSTMSGLGQPGAQPGHGAGSGDARRESGQSVHSAGTGSGVSGRQSPSPAASEWLELDAARLANVPWRTQGVARLALLALLDAQHAAGKDADAARLLARMRGRVAPADVARYLAAGAQGASAGHAVSSSGTDAGAGAAAASPGAAGAGTSAGGGGGGGGGAGAGAGAAGAGAGQFWARVREML